MINDDDDDDDDDAADDDDDDEFKNYGWTKQFIEMVVTVKNCPNVSQMNLPILDNNASLVPTSWRYYWITEEENQFWFFYRADDND